MIHHLTTTCRGLYTDFTYPHYSYQGTMDRFGTLLAAINQGIHTLMTVLFLLILTGFAIRYTVGRIRQNIKKQENPGKGVFLGVIFLVEMAILALLILGLPTLLSRFAITFPQLLSRATRGLISPSVFRWFILFFIPSVLACIPFKKYISERNIYSLGLILLIGLLGFWVERKTNGTIDPVVFRWILLFLLIPPGVYYLSRKQSGWRSFFSALTILIIAFFGWLYEQWVGILFISLPIYTILVLLIFRMSLVILPTSDPEDKKEGWQKFRAFFLYILGFQYPFWVVKDNAGREIETRIPGDSTNDKMDPGIVWTRSHQVVGISAGIHFTEVEGPGVIFTKKYERPVATIDLRTQIRIVDISSTTKDGAPIKAILLAAFRVNRNEEKGIRLNRRIGSFPYASYIVKSLLGKVENDTNPPGGTANQIIHWDDWTVKQIANVASLVLSQRNVDNLWRPVDNKMGTSAADEMAAEIRTIVEPQLIQAGIELFGARVVNFNMPDDDPIRKQQIATWKNLWSQRINATQLEAEAIHKEEIEKAHAFAQSELLDAIADSIEKARAIDDNLPRHVIALYYIHAIEEIMQKQPEQGSEEARKRLETVKEYLIYNE
jgi:hypothetical protein